MQTYNAPLRDMRFVLHELHGLEKINAYPKYADFTPDVVDSVLEEASRIATEVILPTNAVGDQEGCVLENGVVRTPTGFKEAYNLFREGGWSSIAADPEWGGQAMPESVNKMVEEMISAANVAFGLYPGLTGGAIRALNDHGSQELKARYLPKMVDGTWTGAMCLTEAHCGTDLGLLRTKATPNGDGSYRIDGAKIFISAGEHDLTENIVHLVLARLPDGPKGVKGHQHVPGPQVHPHRRRQAGSAQRRGLHRHRAQDGAEGLGHLPADLRGRQGVAGRRAQQGAWPPCSP